ncbi:MAG: class I SAM-dependent methyltransferase [Tenericutes bacterium]|nr:class I SAM-dependent methyltransferase [Mycoplasmatota bacterium]
MNKYKEAWDKIHKQYFTGTIKTDDWLNKYDDIINSSNEEVIDLGCGTGNNSLYLLERGKHVIACDYSDEAMRIVKEHLPTIKTKQFDMTETFPFEDNFTDLVIADLCLHYFSNEDTIKILKELKRVIIPNSNLIFRVNSVNDVNHGAMQGKKIEEHYYELSDMRKRFFDREDFNKYFNDWDIVDLNEDVMTRYVKPKILWKGLVKNIK